MQNKLNLELKYFCKDFSQIRKVLLKIGAKKIGVTKQKDYFFNIPDEQNHARLKLRVENQKQMLVYYERQEFVQNKANPSKVTLFQVKDKKLLNFLKEVLGIKAIVKKKREVWVKQNTIFNLDDVESIGKIFEIETTTTTVNQKKDEAVFNIYIKKFKPFLSEIVRGSNLDLALRL